jgi:hypothetical protein
MYNVEVLGVCSGSHVFDPVGSLAPARTVSRKHPMGWDWPDGASLTRQVPRPPPARERKRHGEEWANQRPWK